ncbi:MAG: C39 family peptidase [Candidatus Schekmanbacteria bacterium]|nr:C39 family peptidase [Candidatus Schekmanbacteria bacterium]
MRMPTSFKPEASRCVRDGGREQACSHLGLVFLLFSLLLATCSGDDTETGQEASAAPASCTLSFAQPKSPASVVFGENLTLDLTRDVSDGSIDRFELSVRTVSPMSDSSVDPRTLVTLFHPNAGLPRALLTAMADGQPVELSIMARCTAIGKDSRRPVAACETEPALKVRVCRREELMPAGGCPVLFCQRDVRWAKVPYDHRSGETLGGAGCAVTALAMLLAYHGTTVDPLTLHEFLKGHPQGFDASGWVRWPAVVDYEGAHLEFTGAMDLDELVDASDRGNVTVERVDGYLAERNPVIISFGREHFYLAVRRSGDTYILYDPDDCTEPITTLAHERANKFSSVRFFRKRIDRVSGRPPVGQCCSASVISILKERVRARCCAIPDLLPLSPPQAGGR